MSIEVIANKLFIKYGKILSGFLSLFEDAPWPGQIFDLMAGNTDSKKPGESPSP
jgi:hypothetical protein